MMLLSRRLSRAIWTLLLPLLLAHVSTDAAFLVHQPIVSRKTHARFVSCAAANKQSTDVLEEQVVNGEKGANTGGIVLQQDDSNKSRLASAFAALGENDQYDAVLTGLCAKILDDTEEEMALSALQDPIQLLTEMNARRVAASGRSLMALIDATAKTHDARAMANILSLCLKNGGLSQYGSLQTFVTPLPTAPNSRVKCPDGSRKTRQERLDCLPNVPVDDRGSELVSALAASSVIGFCVACNVLGITDITPYTNTVLTLMISVGVVDNFYDVLKGAVSLLKSQSESEAIQNFELPEKESMPLSLGTGQVSGTVVRGLTRLINVDTERECQCEAAAFFAAYSLGLPCFAFRPNALEAAVLVLESMKKENADTSAGSLDPLLSNVGILKVLIWLMAPVAMESSKHVQLIVSDPRESSGFLERLEDKAGSLLDDDIFWADEKEDLLKWAYAEADLLLRCHKDEVTALTERLAGGAATVGDCVAVIENW